MATAAVSYARENQKRFLEELKDLLRIPSVSTMEEHKDDVQKAAELVASELKRIGFEHVEVIPSQRSSAGLRRLAACRRQTDRAVLRALRRAAGRAARRVEHASVRADRAQPEHLRARRRRRQRPALDAGEGLRVAVQAPAMASCPSTCACSSRAKKKLAAKPLPSTSASNGEQAEGRLRARHRHRTVRAGSSDAVRRTARTGLHRTRGRGARPICTPACTAALLRIRLDALSQIISKLKDENGHILIPGFYDDVQKPTDAELKAWKRLPFDEEHYRKTKSDPTC